MRVALTRDPPKDQGQRHKAPESKDPELILARPRSGRDSLRGTTAREPIVDVPVPVGQVHAHAAPAVPAIEGGVAQLAGRVLPPGPVEPLVGEVGVGLVDGGLTERVGLETMELVLLGQILVGEVAVAIVGAGTGLEEVDVLLHARVATGRHELEDLVVDVLHAISGLDGLLGRAATVHEDATDDHVTRRFDALTKGCEQHHPEVVEAEYLLSRVPRNRLPVLAHRRAELIDCLVDLFVGHRRWGHGLRHGVILSVADKLGRDCLCCSILTLTLEGVWGQNATANIQVSIFGSSYSQFIIPLNRLKVKSELPTSSKGFCRQQWFGCNN